MKDYKYLASRSSEPPPGESSEEADITSYAARPAWRNQWWRIAFAALLPALLVLALLSGERYFSAPNLRAVQVVIVAVFVYLTVAIQYRHYVWRFRMDVNNVESQEGLIARKVRSIRVRDLRNINVNQTLAQRLLGIGNVEFSSSAGSGVEVVFFGVSRPMRVKALAQRLQGR
ncbi:MAG TPA: PH domain-containing protein [Candidatus Methylomirabilis sp.]|nr:PH domain-containing protein [Candidatus Methylomirabilis sp.]